MLRRPPRLAGGERAERMQKWEGGAKEQSGGAGAKKAQKQQERGGAVREGGKSR